MDVLVENATKLNAIKAIIDEMFEPYQSIEYADEAKKLETEVESYLSDAVREATPLPFGVTDNPIHPEIPTCEVLGGTSEHSTVS